MTENEAQRSVFDVEELSLPEEVQLALTMRPGKLEFGWTQVGAAALAELALEGRVGSVPNRGLFTGGKKRLLTVLSDTPPLSPVLKIALRLVCARAKPWVPYKCVLAIGREVSLATHSELVRHGIAEVVGVFPQRSGYLRVKNDEVVAFVKAKLDRARAAPDLVTDSRTGALVDILHNAGNRFVGAVGPSPTTMREWYPKTVIETMDAILEGEAIVSRSQ